MSGFVILLGIILSVACLIAVVIAGVAACAFLCFAAYQVLGFIYMMIRGEAYMDREIERTEREIAVAQMMACGTKADIAQRKALALPWDDT